jgi:hypothetical protein
MPAKKKAPKVKPEMKKKVLDKTQQKKKKVK